MNILTTIRQRPLAFTALLGLVLIIGAGIWAASYFYVSPYETTTGGTGNREIQISKLTIGAAISADEAKRKDPRIAIRDSYSVSDFLALQVETAKNITTPISLSVRLITEQGSVKQLSPSSLTLPAGSSTFCCWQIPEKGKYRLQIFRPEGTVTSIPLTITPS